MIAEIKTQEKGWKIKLKKSPESKAKIQSWKMGEKIEQ